jgi:hypothetical protein
VEPRLNFVTLGVADIARARAFYDRLGFKASAASNPNVVFYDAGGVVLALFGRAALAGDAHLDDSPPGFSGVAIAHNVASERDVDAVIAEAVAAGGKLVKKGQKAFWGGYSGYFSDPDGHLWEVAHNPFMPLDAKGRVKLPKPGKPPKKTKKKTIDHDAYGDEYISGILRRCRIFAVVGASANPARPSHGVMKFLISKGYTIIPVNPGHAGSKIHGQKVYARLADIPGPVDLVDVFRNPEAARDAVRDAIAEKDRLGIKVVWMQLGVRNDAAAAEAEAAGLDVVMDRCPVIELRRLGLSGA